jgi:Carbohydrate binding domain
MFISIHPGSSRTVSLACVLTVFAATLIGCQQPLGNANTAKDSYTLGGPGVPAAVDAALQAQPPVAAPLAGQTNLLRNPGFETFTGNTPDDWVSCAADGLSPSSDAATGSKAVQVSANRCLFQSAQISAGQNLDLSCQAKLTQDQGWTGWGLTFYDVAFKPLTSAPTRRIISSTYEQYDTTATAPANAKYATVWAYTEGTLLLDQCSLTVATVANVGNLLINGSFEGNLTNWTTCNDANLVGTSNSAFNGSRALRLTAKGCLYQVTDLKPNHEYELTCQAKVTGKRWTEMSLVYMDANWKSIVRQGVPVVDSNYASYSVVLVTPPEMVRSAVAIYNESDEALVDACTLKDTGLEIEPEPLSVN